MLVCKKCGQSYAESVKFCTSCGAPTEQSETQSQQQSTEQIDYAKKIQDLNNTADTTANFGMADIENNKVMAILAYFSWLVLIPILGAPDSKFARFHANQGLVLAITEIIYAVAYSILSAIILTISPYLYFFVSAIGLVGIAFAILSVIGIINAANGRAKELPVIGKLKILK